MTDIIEIRFDSDFVINGAPVKAGTTWGPFEKSRSILKDAAVQSTGPNTAGSSDHPVQAEAGNTDLPAQSAPLSPRQNTQLGVTPKQRALDVTIDRLMEQLRNLRESVDAVDQFRHRLLNPRPAEANAPAPVGPSSTTIESRLNEACNYASEINSRLRDTLQDLNAAV